MTCTVRHDDITYALALSLFFCSLSRTVLLFFFSSCPGFAPSNQIHSFLALSLPSIPARLIIFFLSSVSLTVVIPSPFPINLFSLRFHTFKGEVTEYCMCVCRYTGPAFEPTTLLHCYYNQHCPQGSPETPL